MQGERELCSVCVCAIERKQKRENDKRGNVQYAPTDWQTRTMVRTHAHARTNRDSEKNSKRDRMSQRGKGRERDRANEMEHAERLHTRAYSHEAQIEDWRMRRLIAHAKNK